MFRLRRPAKIIGGNEKNHFGYKSKNLGGKFHREVEPGKECFGIEKRVHSRDLVS